MLCAGSEFNIYMRENWMDGAKGIAMLMVIAVHLAQNVPSNGQHSYAIFILHFVVIWATVRVIALVKV